MDTYCLLLNDTTADGQYPDKSERLSKKKQREQRLKFVERRERARTAQTGGAPPPMQMAKRGK